MCLCFHVLFRISSTIVLAVPANTVTDGWVKLLGTATSDYGEGVAVDSAGNICITDDIVANFCPTIRRINL